MEDVNAEPLIVKTNDAMENEAGNMSYYDDNNDWYLSNNGVDPGGGGSGAPDGMGANYSLDDYETGSGEGMDGLLILKSIVLISIIVLAIFSNLLVVISVFR